MDGRIHLPYVTRTPMGVIFPFRNLGGIFDLGWPYLSDMLTETVQSAIREGRRVLIIITYHFSKGEKSRGCAGFNCDKDAAMAHAFSIQAQMRTLFGRDHQTVYPLVCGFETDQDALIFHDNEGQVLDMASLGEDQQESLPARVSSLYPDMPSQIQRDLLPLLRGNLRHIAAMENTQRTLDIEHREWALCVGRGFDFLHVPNVALIIGSYSPDLSHPIRLGAGIIKANMEQGRIPDDGLLLMSSSTYEKPGILKARAQLKSQFLCDFAADVIRREFPELAKRMATRSTVLNWPERRMEVLEKNG